jgi:hypothetical protein
MNYTTLGLKAPWQTSSAIPQFAEIERRRPPPVYIAAGSMTVCLF